MRDFLSFLGQRLEETRRRGKSTRDNCKTGMKIEKSRVVIMDYYLLNYCLPKMMKKVKNQF